MKKTHLVVDYWVKPNEDAYCKYAYLKAQRDWKSADELFSY